MDKIKKNTLYKEDIASVLKLNCDWLKLKDKTILISGATGLIGTVLVDMLLLLNTKLKLNLQLLLISRSKRGEERKNVKYIIHDINNPLSYSGRIDYIIHAASNTHPFLYSTAPIETITTNVFGTYNLLNLAKDNKNCRFLFVSSVEIYGENQSENILKFSEDDMGYLDCNTLRSGYCEAKRISESLCNSFNSQFDVDFVITRLCRCYGSTLKTDDTKAMSQFLKKGLAKENILLKSNGEQYYSYLYVSDVACGIIFTLLQGMATEAYNIADSRSEIHLKDVAEIIAKKCKVKVEYDLPDHIEQKGYSKATVALLDSSKINSLGWKARFDIDAGIDRTLEIIKDVK